uniref:NB-ARC domain-containing protein n=1 Tax=Salix viminalis TaxID=40686 RepID=A0A6N2MF19_SALVM
MRKLEHDVELSPEVEQIAKSVTKECAGLPLAIITMAGSMRGVDDLHEWRNTLGKLKESKARDMEDEVFRLLRFSYDRLDVVALQQCFLYCALFPEGISRDDLIGYLIDEGMIDGFKSRQAEFDEGHTMLNELENVCLLESFDDYNGCRGVRMHDLIRDMTHQIQLMNCQIMVGEELLDVDKWKEDLVRVSWTSGKLKEISPSHSPMCPNLSTLLLPCNNTLKFIADSFFKQLNRLKILDLSNTNIEVLPDSVSDLMSLSALLLKGCKQLRHVPSLKKLRLLKRLDLSDAGLEHLPQGMEYLSNLRYLKLNGCRQKEFPAGILPKLSSLQVFVLDDWVNGQYAPVTVKGKEVACLRKLETLECHFELFSDLVGYLKSWDETLSLNTYRFLVGQWNNDDIAFLEFSGRTKIVWLCNLDNLNCLKFPTDIQELVILKCIDAKSLCDVLSSQYTTELEYIEIVLCDRMESLLSSSWFCSTPLPFPSNGIFYHLKDFYCYGCTSMKKLFPIVLLPNLLNLEMISVERCDKMEEIIATREDSVVGEESSSSCSSIEFNLPKLRHLSFVLLPELKSICREKLNCSSLQNIIIRDCPKLKRMPLRLPVLDNGRPSPPPSLKEIYVDSKEWWESVEWDHPNSNDALLPFLVVGGGARLLEEERDEEDVEDNDDKMQYRVNADADSIFTGMQGHLLFPKLMQNQFRALSTLLVDFFIHFPSCLLDYRVTNFSIYELQNLIAKCLCLHLSNDGSEIQRAQELSEALWKKRQYFLILDDLWDTYDLEKVGIPIQEKGCKLILTTRSLKVCRGMGCLHKIKVEPLNWDEAWTLFMRKLEHDVELSPEVEQIAKSVTKECAGLPLAIITMAGSMRGVDGLHAWRNILGKLKESKAKMKCSALQQCFLYCALFPEGISRDDLIGYLIDEGMIDGFKSRQAEFDEGHMMLDELENVCLLESFDDDNGCRGVRMHDLIRDMAHQIQLMNLPIMVGEELLDVDNWKEDLVRVSWTSDSFFKQLNRLKILNLSNTNIEVLPDSVSDLMGLSALLLKGCKQLRHVPSLKKLRLLKRLDLSDAGLEHLPQGMEYLSNLRYLKLNGCRQKEFPAGILPKLSSLQVFVLDDWVNGQYAPVTVKGKEVACLRKLETLECHFELFSDLVGYLKSRDETLSLNTYRFLVGQ